MTPEQFNEICIEYVAAPDDHAWDKDHPIFQLAEENDRFRVLLRRCKEVMECNDPMNHDLIFNQ